MNTTPNAFGSIPYYMFPTHQKTGSMSTGERIKNHQIEGWRESDYLDYADFENAIQKNEPVSFALCQWLVRQSYGDKDDAFTEDEWHDWYFYALEHCPRFAREQPRHRF